MMRAPAQPSAIPRTLAVRFLLLVEDDPADPSTAKNCLLFEMYQIIKNFRFSEKEKITGMRFRRRVNYRTSHNTDC